MEYPSSPDMSSASAARDRSQRLQSAKQKLKSYRAKQAQMERAKRQSNASSSTTASPMQHVQGRSSVASSSSLQTLQDVAPACHAALVGSVVSEAAAESNAQLSSQDIATSDSSVINRRHSRNMSRGGAGSHARGHSRTGSISLTQMMLEQQLVQKVQQAVTSPTTAVPAARTSSFVAHTPRSHVRGHSRSGSRSIAAGSGSRSRPSSFIAPKVQEPAYAESNTLESRLWQDDEDTSATHLLPSTFKTPNTDNFAFDTANLHTPQSIAESSSLNGLTPPAPSPGLVRSLSGGLPASPLTPNTTTAPSHARRPSRHARKGSVSTRRESMEIMGGLASLGINTPAELGQSIRHSRRVSSQRWSSLQPASVLFGEETPGSVSRRTSADWRASLFALAPDYDDGGDLKSALDKLEGRAGPSNKRHSRHESSSVQLPSFDDVHGDSGMDKRASLHLIEANEMSTQSGGSTSHESGSTSFDKHTISRGQGNANPPLTSMTSPMVAELQTSIDSSGGEGLGTLLEEEEEEEDSIASPGRSKNSLSIDLTSEEERKRRKALEQEVIQRTRLSSLQPKPLKLKSRPTSVYGTRGMQALASPQADLEVDSGATSFDGENATPRAFRNIQLGDLPSSSERAIVEMSRTLSDTQATSAAHASDARREAWRVSTPRTVSPRKSSNGLTQSQPETRSGVRALRLAGASDVTNISPSGSVSPGLQLSSMTPDREVAEYFGSDTAALMTPRRSSLSYKSAKSAGAEDRVSSDGVPKRRSRSLRPDLSYGSASGMSPTASQDSLAASSRDSMRMERSASRHLLEELAELKAQHARDLTALDEARIAIKTAEEAKRLEVAHMTAELQEQEHKREEEKRDASQRLAVLQSSLVIARKTHEDAEANFKSQLHTAKEAESQMQSQMEDVISERNAMQDDIDGWRQRCSDLERLLRTEKTAGDELRRVRTASKSRIRELLGLLEAKNIHVAHKSIDDVIDFAEGTHSGDLLSALRSPALGPQLPLIGRESCVSPASEVDGPPPPQTIKLLKDMRQQIFNLAGSLEHERKQHLLARQEAEELKAANEKLQCANAAEQASTGDVSVPTMDTIDISGHAHDIKSDSGPTTIPTSSSAPKLSSDDSVEPDVVTDASQLFLGSPSSQTDSFAASTHSPSAREMGLHHAASVSNSSAIKRRKHVFAYDSSMESAMGSFSAGNSASTHQTSDYLGESGRGSMDEVRHEDKLVGGKLGSETLATEVHGLGVIPLDTLAEEEEAAAESANAQSQPEHTLEAPLKLDSGRTSFELAPSSYSDAGSAIPPTPALEQSEAATEKAYGSAQYLDRPHKGERGSSSASSTQTSTDVPVTPHNVVPLPTTSHESSAETEVPYAQESSVNESMDEEFEEEVSVITLAPSRPEFIREWSFEKAVAAVKTGTQKPRLRVGTANLSRPSIKRAHTTGSKQIRRKKGSIDDFFGIMNLDDESSLPPLPTPDEALDMPPLVYTDQYNPTVQSGQFYGSLNHSKAPRVPSIRPPVAKTSRMYGRTSVSDRSSSGSSSNGSWSQRKPSAGFPTRPPDMQRSATMPSRPQYAQAPYREPTSPTGAGMFGRVFSLTSGALSGLGGYIYGPQQMAHDLPRTNMPQQPRVNAGASWTVSRRDEEIA